MVICLNGHLSQVDRGRCRELVPVGQVLSRQKVTVQGEVINLSSSTESY